MVDVVLGWGKPHGAGGVVGREALARRIAAEVLLDLEVAGPVRRIDGEHVGVAFGRARILERPLEQQETGVGVETVLAERGGALVHLARLEGLGHPGTGGRPHGEVVAGARLVGGWVDEVGSPRRIVGRRRGAYVPGSKVAAGRLRPV